MKLVTFKIKDGAIKSGWLKDNGVVDMQSVSNGALPDNMLAFIDEHEKYFFYKNSLVTHIFFWWPGIDGWNMGADFKLH